MNTMNKTLSLFSAFFLLGCDIPPPPYELGATLCVPETAIYGVMVRYRADIKQAHLLTPVAHRSAGIQELIVPVSILQECTR
jgi:hypothetical protein